MKSILTEDPQKKTAHRHRHKQKAYENLARRNRLQRVVARVVPTLHGVSKLCPLFQRVLRGDGGVVGL